MTIIDAHNHPDWLGHDLPKFLANMDRYGIDKTWLLTWECPPDEYNPASYYQAMHFGDGRAYPVPFASCLRYKQAAPDRFVLGYAPDPRRPEAIDQLQAAIEIHGVQVCGEIKLRMLYDNPDALRLFRFCGEKGLPVTFHIDYPIPTGSRYPRTDWWYGGSIDAFERALQACPDTVFIGHAPGLFHTSPATISSTRSDIPKARCYQAADSSTSSAPIPTSTPTSQPAPPSPLSLAISASSNPTPSLQTAGHRQSHSCSNSRTACSSVATTSTTVCRNCSTPWLFPKKYATRSFAPMPNHCWSSSWPVDEIFCL